MALANADAQAQAANCFKEQPGHRSQAQKWNLRWSSGAQCCCHSSGFHGPVKGLHIDLGQLPLFFMGKKLPPLWRSFASSRTARWRASQQQKLRTLFLRSGHRSS
mmetsp:Transcript_123797/g.396268  ORF Transcript_123797/g.396268 Transcript_123797/m.396268 type:complete len:105 (-) Transcript_123797:46-360(-)